MAPLLHRASTTQTIPFVPPPPTLLPAGPNIPNHTRVPKHVHWCRGRTKRRSRHQEWSCAQSRSAGPPPGRATGTVTAEHQCQAQPAPPRAGPAPSLPFMTAGPRFASAGTAAAGSAQQKAVARHCGARTEPVGDSADRPDPSRPPPGS